MLVKMIMFLVIVSSVLAIIPTNEWTEETMYDGNGTIIFNDVSLDTFKIKSSMFFDCVINQGSDILHTCINVHTCTYGNFTCSTSDYTIFVTESFYTGNDFLVQYSATYNNCEILIIIAIFLSVILIIAVCSSLIYILEKRTRKTNDFKLLGSEI